jgi:hypothetical protein
MKVTGPTSGAPGIEPGESPARPGAADAEAPGAADGAQAAGADPTEAAGGAAAAGDAGAIAADIAAELQAGKIGAEAAVEKIIERVLDLQLGPDAPAALREKLRAVLQQTLEDPGLAEKLRGL